MTDPLANLSLPELEARIQTAITSGDDLSLGKLLATGLERSPDHLPFHRLAGQLALNSGDLSRGLSHFSHITERHQATAQDFHAIGRLYQRAGRPDLAAQALYQATRMQPDLGAAVLEYARCTHQLGQFDIAMRAIDRAILLEPDNGMAQMLKGNILLSTGAVQDALAILENARRLAPNSDECLSAWLTASQYRPGVHAADIFRRHDKARHQYQSMQSSFDQTNSTDRHDSKIRLAFMSGNMRRHPVGWFLLPLFQHLDRDKFTLIMINRAKAPDQDEITQQLKCLSDIHIHVSAYSLDRTKAEILRHQPDILIENGGHRSPFQMRLMAQRLAPIQISWMESVGTTGLETMDAILADACHIPASETPRYHEEVLRLPVCYTPWQPPAYAPDRLSNDMPASHNGYITFGSLCMPAKINNAVIDLWSSILTALPTAKLLLKFVGMESSLARHHIEAPFIARGIEADRLLLEGASPHPDALLYYDKRIDIALDPFPYSGGLTCLEAAWMGCPTITLPGHSFPGRHSQCYLEAMDLYDLVARDEADYRQIAMDLAHDQDRLLALRQSMRQRLRESAVMDHAGFVRAFESLMLDKVQRKNVVKP